MTHRRWIRGPVLTTAAALLLAGAACNDNVLHELPPDIFVNPDEIGFGTVLQGVVAEQTLAVDNIGGGSLYVDSVVLVDGSGPFSVENYSGEIHPSTGVKLLVELDTGELGPAEDVILVTSNDPDEPEIEVPVHVLDVVEEPWAEIDWTPTAIDFGAVPSYVQAVEVVTLTSTGTSDLEIDDIYLSPGSSTDFTLQSNPAPVVLPPGYSIQVGVSYVPDDPQADVGTLKIHSNASNEPEVQIPISGEMAPAPDIELDPPLLDFGAVLIGNSLQLDSLVWNIGSADLDLGAITLSGSSDFTLDGAPSSVTLAPQACDTITVTYTPSDTGQDTGQVVIPSNDPDEDPAYLELIGEFQPVPDILVDPLLVDFGVVDIGQTLPLPVDVSNVGGAPLDVTGVTISGSAEFAISTNPFPASLATGDLDVIWVTYSPVDTVADSGTLSIASNDPDEPVVDVQLVAQPTLYPDIDCDPWTIDFGQVPVGTNVTAFTTIHNLGQADLSLTAINLNAPAEFTIVSNPAGSVIPAMGSVMMEVGFTPSAPQSYTGQIAIESNDPDEPVVFVDLLGQGVVVNDPPVADCGGPYAYDPLDTAQFDGSGSHDPNNNVPLSYQWSLVSQPSGSTTNLVNPTSVNPTLWLDLAGTYLVELRVMDTTGLWSTPVTCQVDVVPWQDMHIQLVWDHGDPDLDLHLVQTGHSFFDSPWDCCYCNMNPAWYTGSPDDDPSLDIDAIYGWGPENINIVTPASGTYEVMVHYYGEDAASSCPGGCASTIATVRIYLSGILQATYTRNMISDDQLWDVADIDWPSGVITQINGFTTTTQTYCY